MEKEKTNNELHGSIFAAVVFLVIIAIAIAVF